MKENNDFLSYNEDFITKLSHVTGLHILRVLQYNFLLFVSHELVHDTILVQHRPDTFLSSTCCHKSYHVVLTSAIARCDCSTIAAWLHVDFLLAAHSFVDKSKSIRITCVRLRSSTHQPAIMYVSLHAAKSH